MKAVVYDTDTGTIRRRMTGGIDPDRVGMRTGQALLTDGDVRFPDGWDSEGKMVDTSTDPPTIVDDPDYTSPRTKDDIRQDLTDDVLTEREALLELLEL